MRRPSRPSVNLRVLYTLFSLLIIAGGTLVAIQYAKGSLRITRSGIVQGTGLLSANSYPTGAQIKINGKLQSATNDTLYLEPGEYTVELVKEGFAPWKKILQVQQELVTQTNARLFPLNPSLIPLTYTGVEHVVPSPDGQKIIFYTASASAQVKNGLYVLELGQNLLSLGNEPKQIAFDTNGTFDFAGSEIIWSPDSSEVLVSTDGKDVLLQVNRNSDLASESDVSFRRRQLLSEWQEEMYVRERQFLVKFPEAIIQIATSSAQNAYLSPDKNRLVYTATAAATIPENLVPPIPSASSQAEERTLVPGQMYVYDREEDRNFLVGTEVPVASASAKLLLATDLYSRSPLTLEASPSAFQTLQATQSAVTTQNFLSYHTPLYTTGVQWYPNSRHLMYTLNNRIQIKEYDNSNDTTIYSGPFLHDFVYPWPDGSRVIVLTSFSPDTPPNLYSIELK